MQILPSYLSGRWQHGDGDGEIIHDATFGRPVVAVTTDGLDLAAATRYARDVGGPALRGMTFHARARALKGIAQRLDERKEAFYELSYSSGTTRADAWVDIDGGILTFFAFSSLVRRELPDETFLVEDEPLPLSKGGTFVGRHLLVPREGVAVHINAFNFPVWGMLEKLAPTLLAGVPAIVKPASPTAYLTEAVFREVLASGLLPEGALQLVAGPPGDLLDHLDERDVVTFTGSSVTGKRLRVHPNLIDKSVPFTMEADSLNLSVLGETAQPGSEEFDLFVREVAREATAKAGQKCTAIRRAFVPRGAVDAVLEALTGRLGRTVVGDPRREGVRMGPLVSRAQRDEVDRQVERLLRSSERVTDPRAFEPQGGDPEAGGFYPPTLLYCDRPHDAAEPHDVEAFGPVVTVMPYDGADDVITLAKRGRGSLVGSIVTNDALEARRLVLGMAAYHGRLLVLNRENARESTGHGSPLPLLVHGGPGRAGAGEELGGTRAIKHYMQRTAVQADPTTLMRISNEFVRGARTVEPAAHPFRLPFEELEVGMAFTTHRRTVTEADVVNFAGLSGDYFYMHVDEVAARESMYGRRIAHGYFVVAAAAGLFVDPRPGPVLANYGLERLRFTEPVAIGDTLQATLTVKRTTWKEHRDPDAPPAGVVTWDVQVRNQDDVTVALYEILTLVRRAPDPERDA